jgi:hypothetical protein
MSDTPPTTETTEAVDPLATADAFTDAKPTQEAVAADPANPNPEKVETNQNPDPNAKPEPLQAGAPEAYEFKLPEGMELDTEVAKVAEPFIREANLSGEQANVLAAKLPEIVAPIVERVQKEALAQQQTDILAIRKEWADQVAADPVLGGAEKEKAMQTIALARDTFATPEFIKMAQETGIGNHPEFLKTWLKIGSQLQQGGIHGGGPDAQTTARSTAEKMYGKGFGPAPDA